LATALSRDIIQVVKPNIGDQKLIRITRWATIILGLIPFALAIKPPGIIVVIVGFAFSVIASAFTGPLLIGLFWSGATAIGAWVSMILSTLTCIWWHFTYYKTLWVYPVIPGLIVGIISFVMISWFTPKPSEEIKQMIKAGTKSIWS